MFIGFVFNDHEAGGGLSDAIMDDSNVILEFQSVEDCVAYEEKHGFGFDNLKVYNCITLEHIASFTVTNKWGKKGNLISFKYEREEE